MKWDWAEERVKSQDRQYFTTLSENPEKYNAIRRAALEEEDENAARTLANILFHNPEARQSFQHLPEFPTFKTKVLHLFRSGRTEENGFDFVYWRIFFLVTIDTESAHLFAPIVHEALLSFNITEYSEIIIIEILRALYNISRIKHSPQITSLAISAIKAFPNCLSVVGNAYNLLLNASTFEDLEIDHLLASLTMFAESMKDEKCSRDVIDYLPSFFLVSSAVARQDDVERRHLRKAILPSNR